MLAVTGLVYLRAGGIRRGTAAGTRV
jgi:NNP family nitrate/nitrite transporter-like MFS transporter